MYYYPCNKLFKTFPTKAWTKQIFLVTKFSWKDTKHELFYSRNSGLSNTLTYFKKIFNIERSGIYILFNLIFKTQLSIQLIQITFIKFYLFVHLLYYLGGMSYTKLCSDIPSCASFVKESYSVLYSQLGLKYARRCLLLYFLGPK